MDQTERERKHRRAFGIAKGASRQYPPECARRRAHSGRSKPRRAGRFGRFQCGTAWAGCCARGRAHSGPAALDGGTAEMRSIAKGGAEEAIVYPLYEAVPDHVHRFILAGGVLC
ncbi:MAG TPA: hypothetical protein VEC99_02205 [Clostridia bacterium]|nr:hypothetical protein [Clostridia bacterium]